MAREQAQRRFALAREAVEQYYTGASQEVLLLQPQMASLRKQLLGTALSFYERLQATIEEEVADPRTLVELATVYRQVGRIAVEVGSEAAGLEALERARGILDGLVRDDPTDSSIRRDLASCLDFIGSLKSTPPGGSWKACGRWSVLWSSARRCRPSIRTIPRRPVRARGRRRRGGL